MKQSVIKIDVRVIVQAHVCSFFGFG